MGLLTSLKSFFVTDNKSSYAPGIRVEDVDKPDADHMYHVWPEKNKALYEQLEDTYYQYFIGVNSLLDLKLNAFEIDVIHSLNKTIASNHSLADDIPRLPDVVPKLIHLLRTDDFTWKQVADLIATDPVILVGIIKVANSSFYNLSVNNEQLESILIKIGLTDIREVIMKVALKPIMLFEGGHFLKHSGTKIWIQAVKSAMASRNMAQTYKQDPFEAYLAGLLNNIGMAIVVKKMNDIKEFKNAPRSCEFRNKLLSISKQLSLLIAQSWEVSPDVYRALADQTQADSRAFSPIGAILYQAKAVSMQHILTAEHRWKEEENKAQDDMNAAFFKAYEELNNCSELVSRKK